MTSAAHYDIEDFIQNLDLRLLINAEYENRRCVFMRIDKPGQVFPRITVSFGPKGSIVGAHYLHDQHSSERIMGGRSAVNRKIWEVFR